MKAALKLVKTISKQAFIACKLFILLNKFQNFI